MPEPSHHPPAAPETTHTSRASAENLADILKTSELRYRRLFETARDGILLLDSDQGKITDANPYLIELLDCSRDELIGKELWEIGLLQDKAACQEAFRQLKQDGYIRYDDLPLENRWGRRREVEFVSSLYRENGHTVIQCNIRDITDRKRVEAELAAAAAKNKRIAETLQRSMLQVVQAGQFPGIAVETLYAAALNEADVGGDFFDAFALSREKVAFVVGDVSGKGLTAAARTAEVKYALRAFLHAYQCPELALDRLNDFLCETHRLDPGIAEAFIVLALVVVNTVTGHAVFSAGGAEASLILRVDSSVEFVGIQGMPLGIEPNETYTAQTAHLEVGDTILMATDGITEARQGDTFLSVAGMAALAQRAGPTAALADLSQAIYHGAREFAGGSLRDDVCLLLARRHSQDHTKRNHTMNTSTDRQDSAETKREIAETRREAAETRREDGEHIRDSGEINRRGDEVGRRFSESDREAAEDQREHFEAQRQSVEELRQETEAARRVAEEARESAAESRAIAEDARHRLGEIEKEIAVLRKAFK